MIDLETIRLLPKVALHDHLDGGVRAATVLELAAEIGHELPVTESADALAQWFFDAADSGSLERYLSTFTHTAAVMQSADNLQRIAREFVADMVADGVVYAETRWAPEQHLAGGLSLDEAVEAVQAGLDEGMLLARAGGHTMVARQILTGMRQGTRTAEIAELALRHRDRGVAAFDLAGPERGFPARDHVGAFAAMRRGNGYVTIHAGEADSAASIHEALQVCGAHRIGHGVNLIEDLTLVDGEWELGELATYVRDQRIPLEVCPTSNLQTGVAKSYAEHPVGLLMGLDFNVTVSCDNRLMSRTTLSQELAHISAAHDLDLVDLRWLTINAARAAFWGHDEKWELIGEVIEPGFADLA